MAFGSFTYGAVEYGGSHAPLMTMDLTDTHTEVETLTKEVDKPLYDYEGISEMNDSSLIVYYKMDEISGDLYDSSGNNNTATTANLTYGQSGVIGKSCSFSGNATSYAIKNPVSTFPTTTLTACCWLKSTKAGAGIISYAISTELNNEFLLIDVTDLDIYIHNLTVSVGINVGDGNWHHLAVTWQSSNGSALFYVDGNYVTGKTIATGVSIIGGGSLVLAQDQDSAGGGFTNAQAFSGNLDEVRIYNRVLNAIEIKRVYQNSMDFITKEADKRISDTELSVEVITKETSRDLSDTELSVEVITKEIDKRISDTEQSVEVITKSTDKRLTDTEQSVEIYSRLFNAFRTFTDTLIDVATVTKSTIKRISDTLLGKEVFAYSQYISRCTIEVLDDYTSTIEIVDEYTSTIEYLNEYTSEIEYIY